MENIALIGPEGILINEPRVRKASWLRWGRIRVPAQLRASVRDQDQELEKALNSAYLNARLEERRRNGEAASESFPWLQF